MIHTKQLFKQTEVHVDRDNTRVYLRPSGWLQQEGVAELEVAAGSSGVGVDNFGAEVGAAEEGGNVAALALQSRKYDTIFIAHIFPLLEEIKFKIKNSTSNWDIVGYIKDRTSFFLRREFELLETITQSHSFVYQND